MNLFNFNIVNFPHYPVSLTQSNNYLLIIYYIIKIKFSFCFSIKLSTECLNLWAGP